MRLRRIHVTLSVYKFLVEFLQTPEPLVFIPMIAVLVSGMFTNRIKHYFSAYTFG